MSYKVVLIGKNYVGKTWIFDRIRHGTFDPYQSCRVA
jgi:GTPase SAR1 family protein